MRFKFEGRVVMAKKRKVPGKKRAVSKKVSKAKAVKRPTRKAPVKKAPPKVKKAKLDIGGRWGTIIGSFSSKKLIVIGDLMIDRYIWGDVERISPEAPVPVVRAIGESNGLGGSANVVANIRELGGKVIPLGIVGNDANGQWVLEELGERSIETKYIIKHPTRRTTSKTRVLAKSQQMVRIDREDSEGISGTLTNVLAGSLHSLIEDVDGVIVSDYGKGVVTPDLMRRIINDAKVNNKMVFVDPKLPNYKEYSGCTAITPNHYEAASFVGTVADSKERLMNIGKMIIKTLRCDAALITRGKDGMSLFLGSGKVHNIPTLGREVFDVTGAGDTVISAFALAACAGANWLEAATIANYAAGVVIRKVGAATMTAEDLVAEMKELANR